MRYGELGSNEPSEEEVSGDSSGGMITISDELPIKTRYTVEVAADTVLVLEFTVILRSLKLLIVSDVILVVWDVLLL